VWRRDSNKKEKESEGQRNTQLKLKPRKKKDVLLGAALALQTAPGGDHGCSVRQAWRPE